MSIHIVFLSTLAVRIVPFVLALASLAAGAQDAGYADAVGLMKREQTLGEANAGLLKTFAKGDVAILARGIQLYA